MGAFAGCGFSLAAGAVYPASSQAAQEAQSALARKDYSDAENIYRKMLAKNPDSPEVLTDLGIVLQMEKKSSPAIHEFERALRRRYLPHTFALLAEEECKIGDLDEARPKLARLLRTELQNPETIALVAPCYLDLDEPLESIQVYQMLADYPAYPGDFARIQLSRSYLKAAQLFMSQLQSSPGAAPYLNAIRKARDSDSGNARSAFSIAGASSPYFDGNFTFSQALTILKQHPHDPALLYLLCVLSGEQAMNEIVLCESRYPESPYLKQLQADIFANQGHQEEAAEQYEALMQQHPDLPDLRYSLGMLYREHAEWQKALDVFRQALAADPSDERAAARASEAMLSLRQFEALRSFLRPWVTRKTPPRWARLDFASVSNELGDQASAIRELEAVEEESPADKKIHFRLLLLYRQSGDGAGVAREVRLLRSVAER